MSGSCRLQRHLAVAMRHTYIRIHLHVGKCPIFHLVYSTVHRRRPGCLTTPSRVIDGVDSDLLGETGRTLSPNSSAAVEYSRTPAGVDIPELSSTTSLAVRRWTNTPYMHWQLSNSISVVLRLVDATPYRGPSAADRGCAAAPGCRHQQRDDHSGEFPAAIRPFIRRFVDVVTV